MELTNEFVIDRKVEETWQILNDLEFIAPCMPGAQLQEIEGEEYRGVVKIKVGPITAQYKGKASFIAQDAETKVAKLKAEGRDPRQGNANALITASMADAGDDRTTVNIHTDLSLSGKIASFGRGAIEDVSKKILGQFADNLQAKLETDQGPGAGSDGPDAAAETTAEPSSSAPPSPPSPPSSSAAPSSAARDAIATDAVAAGSAVAGADSPGNGQVAVPPATTVRKVDGPEAEPVDLFAVSGTSMAKRLLPAGGATALVIIILYWILGRG